MNNDEIASIQQIADVHEQRINQALRKISAKFPLTIEQVQSLTEDDLFAIEMLTSRFSKLQDYMGNTVFDVLFEIEGENATTWTPIDKLHKLEKYGILDDAHVWRNMRKSRNFLIHEYPNEPAIIAESLNVIYSFVPELLQIKRAIFSRINKDII